MKRRKIEPGLPATSPPPSTSPVKTSEPAPNEKQNLNRKQATSTGNPTFCTVIAASIAPSTRSKADLESNSKGFRLAWREYPREYCNDPIVRPGSYSFVGSLESFEQGETMRKALFGLFDENGHVDDEDDDVDDLQYRERNANVFCNGRVNIDGNSSRAGDNIEHRLCFRLEEDRVMGRVTGLLHKLVGYASSEAVKTKVDEALRKAGVIVDFIGHDLRLFPCKNFMVYALHGVNKNVAYNREYCMPATQFWLTRKGEDKVIGKCFTVFQNYESDQVGPCIHMIEVPTGLQSGSIGTELVNAAMYYWALAASKSYVFRGIMTVTDVLSKNVPFWRRLNFEEFGIFDEYIRVFDAVDVRREYSQ